MAVTVGNSDSSTDRFAARKAEIIAAALTVIARDGLHAATVRSIAAEMGCTTEVLSSHKQAQGKSVNKLLLRGAIEPARLHR